MKTILALILYFQLQYAFSQNEILSIPLHDSLVNNNEFKNRLITKKFDLQNDSSQFHFLFNSIQLATDYFLYSEAPALDSGIISNLKTLSKLYSNMGLPLILTTGTNGMGGNGLLKLDTITLKFNFIYVTVGDLTCAAGRINFGISVFNTETINHLNTINDVGWISDLARHLPPDKVKQGSNRKEYRKALP